MDEGKAHIPVDDLRRCLGNIRKIISNPTNKAAQNLARIAIETLEAYLPEALREEKPWEEKTRAEKNAELAKIWNENKITSTEGEKKYDWDEEHQTWIRIPTGD
jgi:hypothetical protein